MADEVGILYDMKECRRDFLIRIIKRVIENDEGLRSDLIKIAGARGMAISGSIRTTEAIEAYLSEKKNVKKITVKQLHDIHTSLRAFIAVIGDKNVIDVTRDDAKNFRETIMAVKKGVWNHKGRKDFDLTPVENKSERLSTETVRKLCINVGSFFDFMVTDEKIPKNPFANLALPEKTKSSRLPPPIELVDKLSTIPLPDGCEVDPLEWEVMQMVARYTGARKSEFTRLEVDDFVYDNNILCINMMNLKESGRKGSDKSGRKIIPVADRLRPYIDRILKAREKGRIFPTSGYKRRVDKKFGEYDEYGSDFSDAYIAAAKRIWPPMVLHCWRHYFNSELLNGDVRKTIQQRLSGHSTGDVSDGYSKTYVETAKKAVDIIR